MVLRVLLSLVALLVFAVTEAVAAEPIVRMLVPGFTVQELPVKLSNINNLRFAPDGRLTALGYDGKVWLLRDTDGDGLEDSAEAFWDKPTITVPVGLAWSNEGLLVSSHGKVSLLRDADGDGKADTEEIIASNWPPTDVGSGGVDVTAVTMDKEGNLYFGLLVADYSNAYRLRKRKELKPEERAWLEARGDRGGDPEEQVSLYDIQSKRGTIQKWNHQTKQLETIATGIRVPYTLAFNKAGDLFNTDQEGETWMPNGNPLDELNQIIPGRNYGFPPHHEKWLPNLVSEPPVVAFGPQHESTCGLVFNEPHGSINPKPKTRNLKSFLPASPAQGLFGPKWWEGDAFVAGESRGKIWRVRLVKTPHGYVGKESLIARLSMLTMDLAISPKGDLYVCCHSGLPDWGTGPNGEGKIFKISYTDPKAPQPVMAWAASPTEVRVAFDKPVDPSVTNAVIGQQIEFGEYVRAADRYEVLKPPYQVVKQQEAAPRGKLKVVAANLDNDNQTLGLTTESHSRTVKYALAIPGVKAKGSKSVGETLDVDYDLSGVSLNLVKDSLLNKLPDSVSQKIGSILGNERLYPNVVELWSPSPDFSIASNLLGSTIKWVFDTSQTKGKSADWFFAEFKLLIPADAEKLQFSAQKPFELESDATRIVRARVVADGFHSSEFDADVFRRWVENDIALKAEGKLPVSVSYRAKNDTRWRPLPLSSFHPRWSPPFTASVTVPNEKVELTGGDFERGRSLFFGDQLKCATCHRIRGEGATTGPDLSNLVSRDAASVLRDIKEPSASINPDYVAYNVALRNGDEVTGFIRTQDNDTLRLITADGKETTFHPTEVKEMRPGGVSLMPAGLLDGLNEEQTRDLLTFLLNEPSKREKAEIEQILEGTRSTVSATSSPRHLNIVLVASKQDHGPGQHDYPAWQTNWLKLLGQAPNVTVMNGWLWPTPEQFAQAELLVFYYWNHEWSAEKFQQLDEFLARGGGVVIFHSATISDKEPEELAERIGLASHPQRSKYRHTPLVLDIVAPDDHPIIRGLPKQIHLLDEPYWPMIGDASKVQVLASTEMEGEARPMIWTFQKGKGRVFASIAGHYSWTFDDPLFRILALRGLAWAAGEDAARFQFLATASQ